MITLLLLLAAPLLADLPTEVAQCKPGSPSVMKFLAANVVSLKEGGVGVFENFCFRQNRATMRWKSDTEVEVSIESSEPRTRLCSDNYLLTTLLSSKVEKKFLQGRSTYTLSVSAASDAAYVRANGVSLLPLCDRLVNLVPDLLSTLWMLSSSTLTFLPKAVLDKLRDKNLLRLKQLTGANSVERKEKKKLDYAWLAANVKSGDVYCQYSEDGSTTFIIYGTGGVCSHVGMFLWEGTTLYFVEANPPDVHRYEARGWLAKLDADGRTNINILQLADQYRAKFDVTKAWASYFQIHGRPYGFDNILFSFWDTPQNSFTQLANTDIFMVYFALLAKHPKGRQAVNLVLEQGLNRRLGTTGLSFEQILEEIAKRGMSIGQLGAIPEKESWTYGADNRSRYICSAVVVRLLRDAGALAGLDFVPQELTPNDVYNLKLWKTDRPKECADNDPYLPYCQVTGKFALLPFKLYNSIVPYSHMFEKSVLQSPPTTLGQPAAKQIF